MASHKVISINEGKATRIEINSLEDLFGYKVIEGSADSMFSHDPSMFIVLEKTSEDMIKIFKDSYKSLKKDYEESGAKNARADSLIQQVDAYLEKQDKDLKKK